MKTRVTFAAALLATAACAAPYEDQPYYRPPSASLTRPAAPAPTPETPKPVTAPEGSSQTPAAEPVPPPQPVAGQKLSLAQCLDLALSHNRQLSIATRRAGIAGDIEGETLAVALPQLSASGRYTMRNNDPGVNSPGGPVVFGERKNLSGHVDLLVPLYSFGRAAGRYSAAGHQTESATLTAERWRQRIVDAVHRAYYHVLAAEKFKGVVEDSIEVVKRQVETAREFYAQGLVAQNDVLTAEVQLAEREQQLISTNNQLLISRANLNRLLGNDVSADFILEDVFEAEPWNGSFEAALNRAVDHRPDLLALRRQVEAAQETYKSTRADWFPYAYGFGSYNHTSDKSTLNKDWLSGGIAVEWPLFEGGLRMHQLSRHRKEIEEALDRHNEKADDIVLEVKQAWLELREAADRLPVARKAADLAAENLRIVRDQYSQGLVSSNDVLVEEDRLSRARNNYFSAIYDYHGAVAALEAAVGAPLTELKP